MLDAGCGAGHYLLFGTENGMEMYGNDFSGTVVEQAKSLLHKKMGADAAARVVQSDVSTLPWEKGFFNHVLCNHVLDSMPFEDAPAAIAEIARVTTSGGYLYCSLMAETAPTTEFFREKTFTDGPQKGTVESYFNYVRIQRLIEPFFEVLNCKLDNEGQNWHVVSRRRAK